MTKKLRSFTTTAALVRERLAGAEEVAYDGLPLDQLEVLLRRGHLVGRSFPAGRCLAKSLLDSPLGIIPRIMCRLGICDSRFVCIRVQICVFLHNVRGESAS